jgi:penicillin-binding protein 1A
VSVRLTMEFGPTAVTKTAYRLGIASKLEPNASIALGTSEVSVLELALAFAPFANGGKGVVPSVVERVRGVDGKTLYRRASQSLGRVVDERHVAMMNAMLRETLHSGTAHKADFTAWPAAGKTGTSQDFRDAWFVGYTSHLVTGVWVGNDDNSPTRKTTGGGLPVEVWSRFMKAAHQGVPVAELPGGRVGPTAFVPAPPSGSPPSGSPPSGSPPSGPPPGGPPRPPASIEEPGRPLPPDGQSLDRWLLDRLFGRR